jgi:thymidylate synthase ThyX
LNQLFFLQFLFVDILNLKLQQGKYTLKKRLKMKHELKLPFPVRLLADSTNWTGIRLTSFLIPMPTILISELRTHRLLNWGDDIDFSINANSDRAIPIEKKIQMIKEDPYIPIPTMAQKGMSGIEDVSEEDAGKLKREWLKARDNAIESAETLLGIGASKQFVNRILAPFSWSVVVITGDERTWSAFFNLRCKPDVEPNFRTIAYLMKEVYDNSSPKYLQIGEWHIAFSEEASEFERIQDKLMVSGSCCARVSYNTEREEPLEKHVSRFKSCVESNPPHSSVAEHQARVPNSDEYSNAVLKSNTKGWILLRKILENKMSIT